MDKLTADNEEMKMKLKKVENDFYEAEQKKVKAEELYKIEKENNKAATEVEGQFRSELLKVKAENSTFKSDIKTLETDFSDVSNEKEVIQREIKDLDTKLKVKVKNFTSLEVKMQDLREEKECSDLMNENLLSEFKLSKLSRESQ